MGKLVTGKRRPARLLGAAALIAGGAGAALLAAAGTAGALTCATGTPQASCDTIASLDVTGGSLGVAAPPALDWSVTLNGYNQQAVDATHASYTTVDTTGTAAGWNVTVTATRFTGTGAHTLPNTGTLQTNGSIADESATADPGVACAPSSTCIVPVPSGVVKYPVLVTTGTAVTPVAIYDATAATGLGATTVSPVGWWLNVPADASADTYGSVITLAISTGPV